MARPRTDDTRTRTAYEQRQIDAEANMRRRAEERAWLESQPRPQPHPTLTGRLFGDPSPGRSALDQKRGA